MADYPRDLSAGQDDMSLLPDSSDALDQLLMRDVRAWQAEAPTADHFAARISARLDAMEDKPFRAARRRRQGGIMDTPNAERGRGGPAGSTITTPDGRGPGRGWLAPVAVAAVVLLLVGLFQLVGPLRRHPQPGATPSAIPTSQPTTVPSP